MDRRAELPDGLVVPVRVYPIAEKNAVYAALEIDPDRRSRVAEVTERGATDLRSGGRTDVGRRVPPERPGATIRSAAAYPELTGDVAAENPAPSRRSGDPLGDELVNPHGGVAVSALNRTGLEELIDRAEALLWAERFPASNDRRAAVGAESY